MRLLGVAVACSALSGLLMGYDMCIIADALAPIAAHFSLSVSEKEGVVSCAMAGAVLGSLCVGIVADSIGRRVTIILCGACFMLGGLLMAAANAYGLLLLGRLVIGVSIGAGGSVVAVYTTEIAPASSRSTIVAVNELSLCFGCLVAFLCGWALGDNWRTMIALTVVPSVLIMLGMSLLPESPRWLMQRGRHADAHAASLRLFGEAAAEAHSPSLSLDCEGRAAGGESDQEPLFRGVGDASSDAVSEPLPHCVSWWHASKEVWSHRASRRSLLLSIAAAVAQNLLFSSAVLYYGKEFFSHAGLPHPSRASILIGVSKFLGVSASMCLVGRCRRRVILGAGSVGQILALVCMAAGFAVHAGVLRERLVLVGVFAFVFAWDVSWAPLMWVVVAELQPARHRAVGTGYAIACFWASSVVTNQLLWTLVTALTPTVALLGVAALGLLAVAFVVFKLPETSGLSLEAIQAAQEQSPRR